MDSSLIQTPQIPNSISQFSNALPFRTDAAHNFSALPARRQICDAALPTSPSKWVGISTKTSGEATKQRSRRGLPVHSSVYLQIFSSISVWLFIHCWNGHMFVAPAPMITYVQCRCFVEATISRTLAQVALANFQARVMEPSGGIKRGWKSTSFMGGSLGKSPN